MRCAKKERDAALAVAAMPARPCPALLISRQSRREPGKYTQWTMPCALRMHRGRWFVAACALPDAGRALPSGARLTAPGADAASLRP